MNTIIKFLSSPSKYLLITGGAGTGKTTLIKTINCKYDIYDIQICAPTHEACEVLMKKGLKANTLQSFLKMKPVYDSHGNMSFISSFSSDDEMPDLLIIDECSMVNIEIVKIIHRKLSCKIIYVGDRFQLPPIGEDESMCFKIKDMLRIKLLEQKRTNILMDIYETFRRGVEHKKVSDEYFTKMDLDDILELIKNGYKLIAHRNIVVNDYNKMAKEYIYGSEDGYYSGERIRFHDHFNTKNNKYVRGDEHQIIDVYKGTLKHKWGDFDVYYIKINDEDEYITHIMEHEEDRYKSIAIDQKKITKRKTRGKSKPIIHMLWDSFYNTSKKLMPPFRSNYAMTAYSAQGKSYDQGIIMANDILSTAREAKYKCLYTAVTRFRDDVIILDQ